jgi:hypothetical protein
MTDTTTSTAAAADNQKQERRLAADQKYGVADCLTWTTLNDTFCFGGMAKITKHFADYCTTPSFLHHCAAMGFANPTFVANAIHWDDQHAGFAKFKTCLEREQRLERERQQQQLLQSDGDDDTAVDGSAAKRPALGDVKPGTATAVLLAALEATTTEEDDTTCDSKSFARRCLGLVFHGTATHNIPTILQNGLDAAKRKGQAYGPGEYFAKNPTTSISYCRGGLQMIVFVVVLPAQPKAGSFSVQPADYVVVENNAHHLAIGTLQFTAVDRSVLAASATKRAALLQLSNEALAKSRIKQEAETKAYIMSHLIANKIDWASELYLRKVDFLGYTSLKEISWYVYANVDADTIDYYFPNLPPPMHIDELAMTPVQSFDVAAQDEEVALKKVEQARNDFIGRSGGTGAVNT